MAFPRVSSATPMRNTMIPMTAEKEKAPTDDREYIQMRTNFILEELSKEEMFSELVQKGLRSMTLKNFVMILSHFIKSIVSLPKDFATNYIDFVYNLMTQLEYPYHINKSMLKTPNAPHCMNNIVILISWFAEFSKIDENDIRYKTTDELPDPELIHEVMKYTQDAYVAFNEKKESENIDIQAKISNLYLEMRAGCPGSDVESENNRLKFEIDQLKKEKRPLSLLQDMKTKEDESQKLNDMIKEHNNNIDGLNRKISNLKVEYGSKREAQEHSLRKLESLQYKYGNQKMTMEQRYDLLVEITQLKSDLTSKRNALTELSEISAKKEIAFSNVILKKSGLIGSINNLICKQSSDLESLNIQNSFDPDNNLIQHTKNDQLMNEMIDNARMGLKILQERYTNQLSLLNENMIKLEVEVQKLKTQSDLADMKLRQLRGALEKLEFEESSEEDGLTSLIQNIQSNYNERVEEIEKIKKEIEERKKGIVELEQSVRDLIDRRASFGSRAVTQCRQVYEQRKSEIENRRRELRKTLESIDNYERNREPLPENLQRILDNVMKNKRKP